MPLFSKKKKKKKDDDTDSIDSDPLNVTFARAGDFDTTLTRSRDFSKIGQQHKQAQEAKWGRWDTEQPSMYAADFSLVEH